MGHKPFIIFQSLKISLPCQDQTVVLFQIDIDLFRTIFHVLDFLRRLKGPLKVLFICGLHFMTTDLYKKLKVSGVFLFFEDGSVHSHGCGIEGYFGDQVDLDSDFLFGCGWLAGSFFDLFFHYFDDILHYSAFLAGLRVENVNVEGPEEVLSFNVDLPIV